MSIVGLLILLAGIIGMVKPGLLRLSSRWWAAGIAVLGLVLMGVAAPSDGDRPTMSATEERAAMAEEESSEEPAEALSAISARQLHTEYEKNQIAADERYKDQWVLVTGIVASIGKDILDDPYVALETDNQFMSVQCMLADDAAAEASRLSKGQEVSMRGRVDGKLMGVIVRECTFAS